MRKELRMLVRNTPHHNSRMQLYMTEIIEHPDRTCRVEFLWRRKPQTPRNRPYVPPDAELPES
jgi:hypothetical protein